MDHYRCCHYFVPGTRAYRISGLAELFPQHCQVPCLTTEEHLKGLTTEMVTTLQKMTAEKQQRVLTLINAKLAAHHNTIPSDDFVMHPLHEWMLPDDDPQRSPQPQPNAPEEQRVTTAPAEQRVTAPTPICRITNAPAHHDGP
jgi:hypothetical protein